MMAIRLFDPVEERFLKEIYACYPVSRTNSEARALFMCIQSAFTSNGQKRWGESIMVHPELISHLAACAWVALEYDEQMTIPWDDGAHDYILTRALRYFMSTLRKAIEDGRTSQIEDRMMYGCFTIPRWYFDRCREEEVSTH
jgi:hypothetical protein